MTRTTKEEINGSPLFFLKKLHLILGVIGIVLTQLATMFGAYYSVKEDIRSNLEKIDTHIENADVHMTYSDKVEKFVPRGEFTDMKEDIREIKEQQIRIEAKLDRILNR